MKIAIYSHSIAPSIDGVCRRFTGIIAELLLQGHEILLFTLESEPQDLPISDRLQYCCIPHMFFPAYPQKKIAKPNLLAFYKIYSRLSAFRPDVIHITADGISQYYVIAGIMLGIPTLGSFHTDLQDLLTTHQAAEFQKFVVMNKERLDSHILDSCATTSVSFSRKLSRQGVHCEHIIVTAVDTETFQQNKKSNALRHAMTFGDTNALLCCYVGRISKEKRIDVIINAMKDVPGAYLAIIGDGPSAAVYSAMHGKQTRIYCQPKFLSHHELAEIYASSDIHVTASEFETLGNTVLEAFACKIPVIAPNTQGFCDTVRHGIDGYLFIPGNSEDAKKYILQLKDDPQLRITLGRNGHSAVSNRTVTQVVTDLLLWYQLGRKKRHQRSLAKTILIVTVLLFSAPFTMLAMGTYDMLMTSIGMIQKLFSTKIDKNKKK